jgi:outer membrane receptor for ferrienterochelin and colicin
MHTIRLQPTLCALAAGMACLLVNTSHASAPNSDEEDLAQAYGDPQMVSIATGSRQLISRAPSVATVITAADIQAMGATDLDDVMETPFQASMWPAPPRSTRPATSFEASTLASTPKY